MYSSTIISPISTDIKQASYRGEKDFSGWHIDQVKVSVSFTNHQKLSLHADIDGIHICFWKTSWGICI